MAGSRGSIVGLMALVSFFALALTAIRSGSPAWAWVTLNASVALLLFASIRARFARSHPARAWWFGFALIGWAYFLLPSGWARDQALPSMLLDPIERAVLDSYRPLPLSAPRTDANHAILEPFYIRGHRIFQNFATIALAFLGASAIALTFGRTPRSPDDKPDQNR